MMDELIEALRGLLSIVAKSDGIFGKGVYDDEPDMLCWDNFPEVEEARKVLKKHTQDADFEKVIQDWFCYKKERREKYKSERSENAFRERLKKLSENDVKVARAIIDQSMANNWAGIFSLKDETYGVAKTRVSEDYKRSIIEELFT